VKRVELRAGGQILVAEVPAPEAKPGHVLVQTAFSLVSPGTELGLIERKVGDASPFALGYSASGTVLESQAEGFSAGDAVACYGGPYTYHGSVLSVPRHLVRKVPAQVSLREAAFGGLGTVAVHSVRQARPEFGEVCLTVGLGVLGNLIAQVARAAGLHVLGTDAMPARLAMAETTGLRAVAADQAAIKEAILRMSEGHGADSVLVCAGGEAAPFLDQAIDAVRLRGRVVIVGNIPGQFQREPFFQKEAEILIARAGGPGRYDLAYERDGHDYPLGYVRWTEGRNLGEFLRLISAGLVRVEPLITHEFAVDDAASAYRVLREGNGAALGVLLRHGG